VLLSKLRHGLGADRLGGRTELELLLPPATFVDAEAALEGAHRAETCIAEGRWAQAWGPAGIAYIQDHNTPDATARTGRQLLSTYLAVLLARRDPSRWSPPTSPSSTTPQLVRACTPRTNSCRPLLAAAPLQPLGQVASRGSPVGDLASPDREPQVDLTDPPTSTRLIDAAVAPLQPSPGQNA
jgi:hypothetical protein